MGAKFKVGDRVVCIDDNFANHELTAGATYTVTGLVVPSDLRLDGCKSSWMASRFEPALRIEAGKYYLTRDGRKVGPATAETRRGHAYTVGGNHYEADGTHYYGDSWRDIIAEWPVTPANPAAQVDNLRDEYGGGVVAAAAVKPKFKVGDRVQYTKDAPKDFWMKPGYTGTILSVDGRGMYSVGVDYVCGDENWYRGPVWGDDKYLELANPTTHAIVAVIENGVPKPAKHPHVHATTDSAKAEAARLAAKNKGQEFGVYELVHTAKEAKVYEHEWQRLAAGGDAKEAARLLKDTAGIPLQSAKGAVEYWLRVAA